MTEFSQLAKLVKELDGKEIWAYMLEIATVIDGDERLSAKQKQDAYDLASVEFENAEDGTIGANVFAGAAIDTVLDENYDESDAEAVHDLFNEKYDWLVR